MKKRYISLLVFLSFSFYSSGQGAIYTIEFISNWSSAAHPTNYPALPSWSPLIGVTHNTNITFYGIGQVATNGVEQVAENGRTDFFINEINTSIGNGNAYKSIEGSDLASGLGTITVNNVDVDINFPYISLMTMIAPSPDWIAQISGVKLTDAGNNWMPSISIDVFPTDAGTDSGTTYMSANMDTNPKDPMSSLENMFPFSNQIIGTYVLTLTETLSVADIELSNSILVYPNPLTDKVFIEILGNDFLKSVEIYSSTGRKVKNFKTFDRLTMLDLNSLDSGLYFMKLNSNIASTTRKLIIR
jgi:hypothetical protein